MKKKRTWKIPVNGVFYKVEIKKNFAKKTGFVGLCNFTEKKITLDSDLTPAEMIAAYVHEIIHAHDHESGWVQVNGDRAVMELSAEGRSNFLNGVLDIKIKKF